jgi:hypothetical protein
MGTVRIAVALGPYQYAPRRDGPAADDRGK